MCIEGVALLIVKGQCMWLYRGKVEEGLRRSGGDDRKTGWYVCRNNDNDDNEKNMAKYKGEKANDQMVEYIYSSWHGRPYKKRRPESVANPQTEAQQAHRNAFAEISRLSSAMKEGHTIGLHYHAVRMKLNTYSVFKKFNKECFGADGIVYPDICIARGSVERAYVTSVEVRTDGGVHVAFLSNAAPKDETDEFYLFVFCPDQHEGCCAPPVARTVGVVDARIPDEWMGHPLHLYAFMRKRKSGRTSDSEYLGLFNTNDIPDERK